MLVPRRYATLIPKPAPRPPDNALLVEWWDASLGIGLVSGLVDTWTGQKRGIVLTAPGTSNRPSYTIDVAFRNRLAISESNVNATQLRSPDTISPDVVAAGARPYTISVWHWVGSPIASLTTILLVGNIPAGGSNLFGHYVAVNNDVVTCSYNGATSAATIAGVGTKLHTLEFWADGTNLNVRDNGNLQAVAFTGSLNVAAISVRDNTQGGTDNNVFHAIFTSKPSDAYIAELKNWLRIRYGS